MGDQSRRRHCEPIEGATHQDAIGCVGARRHSHRAHAVAAFVANAKADTVTVIDLKSWQIVDRLTVGKEPDGLGYSPLTL